MTLSNFTACRQFFFPRPNYRHYSPPPPTSLTSLSPSLLLCASLSLSHCATPMPPCVSAHSSFSSSSFLLSLELTRLFFSFLLLSFSLKLTPLFFFFFSPSLRNTHSRHCHRLLLCLQRVLDCLLSALRIVLLHWLVSGRHLSFPHKQTPTVNAFFATRRSVHPYAHAITLTLSITLIATSHSVRPYTYAYKTIPDAKPETHPTILYKLTNNLFCSLAWVTSAQPQRYR